MNSTTLRAPSQNSSTITVSRHARREHAAFQLTPGVAVLIGLLLFCRPIYAALNYTHVVDGAQLAALDKPAKVDSFVLTDDNKFLWDGATPYVGTDYPATLNTFPGPPVDVVMQQCFGGGFAAGMQATINQYTFTASTSWNQLSWNRSNYALVGPPSADTLRAVDNFTRAWNESFPRSEGLYQHYLDALNGAAAAGGKPAVVQDPFAPGGPFRNVGNKVFEDPSYASPDALVGGNPNPAGANNSRDIVSNNQYAVLAAWKPDNPRFDANIDRIYASLRSINIPENHIIVLDAGISAVPNLGMGLAAPPAAVVKAATLANFQDAVAGKFFNGGAMLPDGSSHLFVYNTGHGLSWDNRGAKGKATVPINPGPPKKVDVAVSDMPVTGFTDADGSDSNSGSVDLGIATRTPLDPTDLAAGVSVTIDNMLLSGVLQNDPTPIDLSGVIGSAFYYDISVPLSLLNSLSPGSPVNVGLDNIHVSDVYDSLVAAVSFDAYGDVWSVGVEPLPVLGDYNRNGIVDAADYTVWRDSLGQIGAGLAADGNQNGSIDAGDYGVWKSNFGHTGGNGLFTNGSVPEPSTLWMLLAGILTLCARRLATVS